MSVLATMVFKRLYENSGSIFLAEALDELHFRVNAVIVANKSADKTDDNDGRVGQNGCGCSGRLRARPHQRRGAMGKASTRPGTRETFAAP